MAELQKVTCSQDSYCLLGNGIIIVRYASWYKYTLAPYSTVTPTDNMIYRDKILHIASQWPCIPPCISDYGQGSLLLIWFNFDPNIDE